MAHIWIQEAESDEWVARVLEREAVTGIELRPLRITRPRESRAFAPLEVSCADRDGMRRWVLMVARQASALINGRPCPAGIRALRDRDELVVEGGRLYFSSEEMAAIVPFPGREDEGAGRGPCCARCKGPLAKGGPAVRCPACGSWHHQDEAAQRPCWTYVASCAVCSHATAFAPEFRWSPEHL